MYRTKRIRFSFGIFSIEAGQESQRPEQLICGAGKMPGSNKGDVESRRCPDAGKRHPDGTIKISAKNASSQCYANVTVVLTKLILFRVTPADNPKTPTFGCRNGGPYLPAGTPRGHHQSRSLPKANDVSQRLARRKRRFSIVKIERFSAGSPAFRNRGRWIKGKIGAAFRDASCCRDFLPAPGSRRIRQTVPVLDETVGRRLKILGIGGRRQCAVDASITKCSNPVGDRATEPKGVCPDPHVPELSVLAFRMSPLCISTRLRAMHGVLKPSRNDSKHFDTLISKMCKRCLAKWMYQFSKAGTKVSRGWLKLRARFHNGFTGSRFGCGRSSWEVLLPENLTLRHTCPGSGNHANDWTASPGMRERSRATSLRPTRIYQQRTKRALRLIMFFAHVKVSRQTWSKISRKKFLRAWRSGRKNTAPHPITPESVNEKRCPRCIWSPCVPNQSGALLRETGGPLGCSAAGFWTCSIAIIVSKCAAGDGGTDRGNRYFP